MGSIGTNKALKVARIDDDGLKRARSSSFSWLSVVSHHLRNRFKLAAVNDGFDSSLMCFWSLAGQTITKLAAHCLVNGLANLFAEKGDEAIWHLKWKSLAIPVCDHAPTCATKDAVELAMSEALRDQS